MSLIEFDYLFTLHADMTRVHGMACHVNTLFTEFARVTQLNVNLKLKYPIKFFYNSMTQIKVSE